ncbi:protocatechuate 3,4-dioxygenase [Spirosoma linguale]|uniref:Intradiol ring-cleavage dioxygenase n=1 Tax=Spirosoma linguale (strain ATCC 33905 / DSM 74 / LMG 10896 / Claus 1) TaxID=504472 RepID=D2QHU4_SPILD|nr:intradiol ring-cleavage dioxygenase [Spirosoma linguale DSM 74]
MEKQPNIPRRSWLRLSVGLAAGTVGTAFTLTDADKDRCAVTPRQELGPFPTMQFRSQADHDVDLTQLTGQAGIATGEVIIVKGQILDTSCQPIAGAIVEIWQANHHGKYRHEYGDSGQSDPNFQGWAQAVTNANGEYQFKTILPGLYGHRARHIHYKVAKRGYHELVTQLYFDGEDRNRTDEILNSFTHEEQMRLTGKLDKTTPTPTIEFTINLDKVQVGALPAKVLADYTGEYVLQAKGTDYEQLLNTFLGGPYDKVTMQVEQQDGLLYLTTTKAPKAELFWKAKDQFDAASFYDTVLTFGRNAAGKVVSATFRARDGQELHGTRV